MVKKITCRNFGKEIVRSPQTVYLLSVADWCRGGRGFGSYFERVSSLFGEDVKFCVLNVDQEPELTEFFGICNVPTVAVIRQGRVYKQYSELLFRQKTGVFLRRRAKNQLLKSKERQKIHDKKSACDSPAGPAVLPD